MKKETNKNRLNGKDLMNVGIFTAINVIGGVLIAVAIGLTPIGFMLIPFVAAIILGIPMIVYEPQRKAVHKSACRRTYPCGIC